MSKKRFLKVKILLVMLCAFNMAHAQFKTITGTVKDDKGAPLANATVNAKGAKAVKTAADGTFSIAVPASTTSLVVSNTEFKDKTVDITGSTTVDVQLVRNVTELSEVVVVGYGTQKVKDVTGSISKVKGEDLKNLATSDVATAIQGRVAGVDVAVPSGEPNASAQITIRGAGSLFKSEPLYIIDGVRQTGGNNISPQDIESISVLKDASAAAIYGSAAAGGVIIITTKRGKGATPSINFSARYGLATPETVPLLNKADFIRYEKDIHNFYYLSTPQSTLDSFNEVDWNKELYRNAAQQNFNLSISGASPSVNYFISGTYDNQDGVFLDNTSSTASARINTDVKITPSIKIGEEMSGYTRFTIPVKTPIVSTPFITQPVMQGGAPYSPIPGTPWGVYPSTYNGTNPLAQIKSSTFEFPSNNFQGQVYLEVKLPVKYMTFKATFGYTSQSYENNLFQNRYTSNGTPLTSSNGTFQNTLYRNIGNYSQTLNAYILAYDHTWGKHTVNLLAGYEQYADKTENLMANVTNVLGTSFAYFPSSSSLEDVHGGYDQNGLNKSIFGRINYDFNKHYYVTATVRRDGNFTTFGPSKQYGIFPAYSAGWNIDQERFFKKLRPIIGSLKLRGSYGELGNSSIGRYNFISTYNNGLAQSFSPDGTAQISYTQESIANADIQWESTHETNIGIDGQALDGKLYFTIDWYNKNTTKLLYSVPVSLSSGVPASGNGFAGGQVSAGKYLENLGSVRNRGLDIAIGYSNKIGKLSYSIGGTGSFNANKVLSIVTADGLPDGNNNYPTGNSIWGGQALTRTYNGYAFGQFWGLKSLGIIRTPAQLAQAQASSFQSGATYGDLLYASDTPTIIGNPYPKFTYGLTITASWENWDIAMLFNGVAGVDLYNGVTPFEFESVDNSNVTSKVFQSSDFTDNSVNTGVTKYPSVGHVDGFGNFQQDPNHNYTTPSSFFVENGSYFKLKNLQIGYTLSSKLLQKVKIKSLRVYAMANNLFTITKYTGVDPELGSQYATLGLDANGNVTGNADGTSSAKGGSATTSRGIDGPNKYPNIHLYAVGLNLVF